MWVMMSAALVFIMQAGFMCLEAGLATAKNSINVAIKNLGDFVVASILFWAFGFGIMFGQTNSGWIGGSDFFVSIKEPWTALFFAFQAVFAGTAATIDSGAVAGRTKFSAYLIMSALISCVIYPVFGHWAWGGLLHDQAGWLEAMGFKDFAGSTVVHSVGGWMALVGVLVIGPRIEKFSEDGTPNKIAPHNMTLAYLGTFILFFGWFGFNCGSTLEASPDVAKIALNTILGASFGCLSSSVLSWVMSPLKRPEGEMIANGILGGLVGITAGCAFVETTGAMWIGLVSGVVVYYGTEFTEKVLKVDDVVGAFPVHGLCGAWGTLAVGFFILPEYLGEMTRWEQIKIQLLGVGACFAWSFGFGYLLMKSVDYISGGMRVSRDAELLGLNIAEHGASSSLLDLVKSMHRATKTGDFSQASKVDVEIGTEMGDLAEGFNKMVDAIERAFYETKNQVKLAEKAKEEAEGTREELAANRLKYNEYIQDIAQRIKKMMGETESSMQQISERADQVQNSVEDLRNQSAEIDEIINQISHIAFSVKILSLNANIEASHAGEAGNSFAVVADSMTGLSHQASQQTDDIARIIEGIQERLNRVLASVKAQYDEVKAGKEKVKNAGKLLQSLLDDQEILSGGAV